MSLLNSSQKTCYFSHFSGTLHPHSLPFQDLGEMVTDMVPSDCGVKGRALFSLRMEIPRAGPHLPTQLALTLHK